MTTKTKRPPVPANREFAARCRAAREKAGLTRLALAEKLGVTQQTIYHLETGLRGPSLGLLLLLCKALGTTPGKLAPPGTLAPTLSFLKALVAAEK